MAGNTTATKAEIGAAPKVEKDESGLALQIQQAIAVVARSTPAVAKDKLVSSLSRFNYLQVEYVLGEIVAGLKDTKHARLVLAEINADKTIGQNLTGPARNIMGTARFSANTVDIDGLKRGNIIAKPGAEMKYIGEQPEQLTPKQKIELAHKVFPEKIRAIDAKVKTGVGCPNEIYMETMAACEEFSLATNTLLSDAKRRTERFGLGTTELIKKALERNQRKLQAQGLEDQEGGI